MIGELTGCLSTKQMLLNSHVVLTCEITSDIGLIRTFREKEKTGFSEIQQVSENFPEHRHKTTHKGKPGTPDLSTCLAHTPLSSQLTRDRAPEVTPPPLLSETKVLLPSPAPSLGSPAPLQPSKLHSEHENRNQIPLCPAQNPAGFSSLGWSESPGEAACLSPSLPSVLWPGTSAACLSPSLPSVLWPGTSPCLPCAPSLCPPPTCRSLCCFCCLPVPRFPWSVSPRPVPAIGLGFVWAFFPRP